MTITRYIVELKDKDKYLLYNTANGGTVRVNSEIYNKIKSGDITCFTEEESNFLKKTGFMVDDNYDEEIIKQIEEKVLNSVLDITFITTEQCNFSCPYCYEEHKSFSIGKEVYDNIFDLIKKSDKEKLYIAWFGGEPTLQMPKIKAFMERVRSLNKFKSINSEITTNGYLLNEKNFKTLIDCGVTRFQVTIDGLKEEHDKFRHLKNGAGTFDVLVKNIKAIKNTDYDFSFLIRNNYNSSSNLLKYVDFIYNLVGNDKRFSLLFSSTGTWTADGEKLPTGQDNADLDKAIKKASQLGLYIPSKDLDPLENVFCCANFNNSFVVNYKGQVLKCTVKLDWDKNVVGVVQKDGTIDFNENFALWQNPHKGEKCIECNVRPVCMGRYCPHTDYSNCKAKKTNKVFEYLKRVYVKSATDNCFTD